MDTSTGMQKSPMTSSDITNLLKSRIESYHDFPKKGVIFRDVFSLLNKPAEFKMLIEKLEDEVKLKCPDVDVIVGLDSRGFLFAPSLALKFNVPFVPIRKAGKLPGDLAKLQFDLEYGKDTFEIQKGSILPGQKVVIVDDLLATGGSMKAAQDLIVNVGGVVSLCLVVIELTELKGRDRIDSTVRTVLSF